MSIEIQGEQKEESKESFYAKNKYYILFFIVVIIIVSSFFLFISQPNYKFSFREQGFLFVSNDNEPLPLLAKNALNDYFILAVSLTEEQSQANSLMANNSMIPFITVLSANKKDTMLLAKIYKEDKLIKCFSNYGDPKKNIEITAENCLKLINDQSLKHSTIEVMFPNTSLNETIIEVNENMIILKPKSFQDLQNATIITLRLMYANTDSVIKNANILVKYLT